MKPEVHVKCCKLGTLPESVKARLRYLTDGPDGGTMYRWTFHDGSTYCAIAYSAPEMEPWQIVGWACITHQEEPIPVVGAYVSHDWRGNGVAPETVKALLEFVKLREGSRVYAATDRWPKWTDLLLDFDLRAERWV